MVILSINCLNSSIYNLKLYIKDEFMDWIVNDICGHNGGVESHHLVFAIV